MEILGVERNYASLSIRDVLEARDLYHFHLIHRANVVGTAIGLYLIRSADPWPDRQRTDREKVAGAKRGERTLHNSEVRDYSWPCVQVFVSEWVEEHNFGAASPARKRRCTLAERTLMADQTPGASDRLEAASQPDRLRAAIRVATLEDRKIRQHSHLHHSAELICPPQSG
jgi:hypothetical protein